MNGLIVAVFAALAVASATPSGHIGTVVAGPSGIVTGHGAIGPVGHGIVGHGIVGHGLVGAGLVGHGAVLSAPVASAVVAGPAVGLGLGHGIVAGHGLGLGVVGHGLGLGAITNGGGAIGVSAHGAAIRGPHTAPVVVAGPSGKVVADGLWGPTHNVGLGHHGHHGW